MLDQEAIEQVISTWRHDKAQDLQQFRKCKQTAEGHNSDNHLLLVQQAEWLLKRYSQDMMYLDATYKTIKFAIPPFFLCIHTKFGYMVVASFVVERDDSVMSVKLAVAVAESVILLGYC